MPHTRRVVRIAAVALLLVTMSFGGESRLPLSPSHTLSGVAPDQERLVDWALGRFAAAGLTLPPVDFVRSASRADCAGRTGRHVFDGHRSTITICTSAAGRREEFVFVHELAHAWDHHQLTAERRAAFLALRGLRDWRNDDPLRWIERGAEHAAEILTWGLMDRPVRVARLPDAACSDLVNGYVALVGVPPSGPSAARCTTWLRP